MRAGQAADKLLFMAIYAAVAVMVVLSARGMIHYALDAALYRDYLAVWESSLTALRRQHPHPFAGRQDDPVAQMASLVELMRTQGIAVPSGNTDRPYVYRLNRFGGSPRNLLLVGSVQQIRLYNVPQRTMLRLDRFIDGQVDPTQGRLTATPSADGITWIVQWRY